MSAISRRVWGQRGSGERRVPRVVMGQSGEKEGLRELQQQPAHHHEHHAVCTELPSGLNRPWCLLPALLCLGKSIVLRQELYRVHLEPVFRLPCSTASATTFPSQSPRQGRGQDSAAPRAVVREILHSRAGPVARSVEPLHAHTWARQLEDLTVLPALLKVPADDVSGSSRPLAACCCGLFVASKTWGGTQGLDSHSVLSEQGCQDAACSPGTSLCPGNGALTTLLLHALP